MKVSAGRDEVLAGLDVSRETIERLDCYAGELVKWTRRINLVAKSTVENLWERHIADSLQVAHRIETQDQTYCDIGSGGGLPGLIVAAVLKEKRPHISVNLVESDQRKCAFLLSTARAMDLSINVISERVENVPPMKADVMSARALADLSRLLTYCQPHLAEGGRCLFLKGASYRQEVKAALEFWRFESKEWVSRTNDQSVLLELRNIANV